LPPGFRRDAEEFHALRIHREGWDPPVAVIPGNAVMSAGVAVSQGSSLIRPLARSMTCTLVTALRYGVPDRCWKQASSSLRPESLIHSGSEQALFTMWPEAPGSGGWV
jgi:hypothetical protein